MNDTQTLSEAGALGRAGLRVVVIGLLRRNLAEHEHYENFEIHRIPPVGLLVGSRWRPTGKANSQSRRSSPRKRLPGIARKLPRPLRSAATGLCLLQAAWKENAAYYHAHSSISLMLGLLAVSKLRQSRFVADYNDILVLEKPDKVTNRYELDDLWGGEVSEVERSRIKATVSLIPNEMKSVLDVGCGDGRLTNLLQGAFDRVVGLDMSETGLRYVNGETVRASAANNPFPDHSFDTVVSTETIEHLPHDVYGKAINEIKRVAKD
ncbi:MAG: class I SAM-dependent methyltransferase, partial [Proteobacteria bacterium]|nr:class I SAM-dependent methyltransferase [Pseudomonadota bacterium]